MICDYYFLFYYLLCSFFSCVLYISCILFLIFVPFFSFFFLSLFILPSSYVSFPSLFLPLLFSLFLPFCFPLFLFCYLSSSFLSFIFSLPLHPSLLPISFLYPHFSFHSPFLFLLYPPSPFLPYHPSSLFLIPLLLFLLPPPPSVEPVTSCLTGGHPSVTN